MAQPTLPANALPLPLVRQATSYSCGPAALLSVLQYWNAFSGAESDLYAALDTTPEEGTEPPKLAEVAASHGLTAYFRDGLSVDDLRAALSRGETVIVSLQAWREGPATGRPWNDEWDSGHYAVLVALDTSYAYFMDPSASAGYAFVPIPELLDRWHDIENRHGRVWRHWRLAVFIKGKNALKSLPGPLVRME